MSGAPIAHLESKLDDEEAEQWRALRDAEDELRVTQGVYDELAEAAASLRRRRSDACPCGEVDCQFYFTDNKPLSEDEVKNLADAERTLTTMAVHLETLRKAKRTPSQWLDERGLLDPLWRALWAERHARERSE